MRLHITLGAKTVSIPVPSFALRQNPTIRLDYNDSQLATGVGGDWTPSVYGDYYPTSVSIYAAIKLRADTIAQVPLRVMRDLGNGESEWVGLGDSRQQLLDRVNPYWTRGDLWRATETYLGLWGSAYWYLIRGSGGAIQEIWPLRPDRMKILPDPKTYIKGFVYSGSQGQAEAFEPEEILWFRYFNPKEEYSGLSPIAPLRLSADMGSEALVFNRSTLRNDTSPGVMFEFEGRSLTTDQAEHFWALWDKRHRGPRRARRPALLPGGAKPHNLGFKAKDIELLGMMRWSLEDVSRAFNVPKGMLHDIERATYANYETMFKIFLLTCIEPQLTFYQEELAEMLFPSFGDATLRPEFDTMNVKMFQEAEKDKGLRLRGLVEGGIITPNEARKDLGMNPWEPPEEEGNPADELKGASTAEPDFGFAGIAGTSEDPPLALPSGRRQRAPADSLAEQAARAFFNNVKSRETELQRFMRLLFRRQTDSMLQRIGELREARYFAKDDVLIEEILADMEVKLERTLQLAGAVITNGRQGPGEGPGTGGSNIFNASEWNEDLKIQILPRIQDALASSARRQVSLFGLGIDFLVSSGVTQKWLDERAEFIATRTNLTTSELIISQLKLANEAGESTTQIAERIRRMDRTVQLSRSFTIARTENVTAANEGHIQAYEQAGVLEKQWFTSRDERVRGNKPTDRFNHVEAHEQIRGLSELFDVSGEKLRAPGQGGSAGNVINCRCNTLPVT